jgi:asparaginyl-tRNA synthetase
MLEAELAFVEDVHEVMDVVESMLRAVANNLQQSPIGAELLQFRSSKIADSEESGISSDDLQKRWQSLAEGPWPRITFEHAIVMLNEAAARGEATFEFPPAYGEGLHAEHERYLAEHLGHHGPIFITDYPRDIKPFYMPDSTSASQSSTLSTVACFDLIVPDVCEIVGGSLREHRLSCLVESMKRRGLGVPVAYDARSAAGSRNPHVEPPRSGESQESLDWYLDLRRYGSVPHGGFGLGFDRLLSYLSGVPNIRDVVGFPRWYGRCDC